MPGWQVGASYGSPRVAMICCTQSISGAAVSSDNNANDPLALCNQLCFSIYAAGHSYNRLYAELLDRLGLTYTQYLVLLVLLSEEEGLTVREIGQRLTLDSGTLTPLLKRLAESGYVYRERSTEDLRQVRVYLTEEGRRARSDFEELRRVIFDATGMTLDELKELKSALDRLRAALDEATADYGQDQAPAN